MSRQPRQLNRYVVEAEKLGRVLREARAEAGMTQVEVAGISGVPYSTLRAIERAHVTEPSFFAVMDICSAIDLKPAKLGALFWTKHRRATRSGARGQGAPASPRSRRSFGASTDAVVSEVSAPSHDA